MLNFSRPLLAAAHVITAGTFEKNPTNTRHGYEVFIHDNYNSETFENDIALVKVTQTITSSSIRFNKFQ